MKMSKYTTQVRFICETAAELEESVGYDRVNTIIAAALPKVFNFQFPIFDEAYREVLETKILKHYYTREIALESVGLWKLKLDTKLNEIMPYYNQLYKSQLLEFNPFYDVDLTTDHKLTRNEKADQKAKIVTTETVNINEDSTVNNDSNSTTNNSSNETNDQTNNVTKTHFDKYSDTPQGALANIENGSYLTNVRLVNDTDTQTNHNSVVGNDESHSSSTNITDSESNSNSKRDSNTSNTSNKDIITIDDYLQHVKGKNGSSSYSSLLNEYRTTFLNIDMLIITELSELFFNLY